MKLIKSIQKLLHKIIHVPSLLFTNLKKSTKVRNLTIFSFLLLVLPVVVISALRVTKYQQHAAGHFVKYYTATHDFELDVISPTAPSYKVGDTLPVNVAIVDNKAPDGILVKVDCSLNSGMSQQVAYGSYLLNTSNTVDSIQITDQEFDSAYPGQMSGQFYLHCTAWKKLQGHEYAIPIIGSPIGASLGADNTGNTDAGDFTIFKTGSGCPHPSDTKTYSNGERCYSSTGLGFNTVGGEYTCGPVACPGDKSSSLPHGNTCTYSESKDGKTVCFAGYGDNSNVGGFNPPGCHYNPMDYDQPIACPSSLKFSIHVDGTEANMPIPVLVNDNGRTHTYQTDANGNIAIQSFSGDKIILTPQASTSYTSVFPSSITTVMNTSFGCGTNGVSKPCTFIVTATISPSPTVSPSPTTCVQQVDCTMPPEGCVWQKTDSGCGCGILVCSSQTPTPTPASSCQKTCPALPQTCHYPSPSGSMCCTPQADGSCSCPGFVCE